MRNHTCLRRQLGAQSVIPAKRGKKTWQVRGVRAEMRRVFPRQLYRRLALIGAVFSSLKRKLSARAPGDLSAINTSMLCPSLIEIYSRSGFKALTIQGIRPIAWA